MADELPAEGTQRVAAVVEEPAGLRERVHHGARGELGGGRCSRLPLPHLERDQRLIGVGREIHQDLREADASLTVDEAVMHLDQQRGAAVLEPLDPPRLPERAAPVEGTRVQQRGELVQIAQSALAGQRDPVDVSARIEALFLDEVGAIEPEGHLVQLPGEARHERDALLDPPDHVLEAEAVIVATVHQDEPADVAGCAIVLDRNEDRVAVGELVDVSLGHGLSVLDVLVRRGSCEGSRALDRAGAARESAATRPTARAGARPVSYAFRICA